MALCEIGAERALCTWRTGMASCTIPVVKVGDELDVMILEVDKRRSKSTVKSALEAEEVVIET